MSTTYQPAPYKPPKPVLRCMPPSFLPSDGKEAKPRDVTGGQYRYILQSVSSNVTVGDNPTTHYHTLHPNLPWSVYWRLGKYRCTRFALYFATTKLVAVTTLNLPCFEWYRPNLALDELAKETNDLVSAVLGYPVIFDHYRYVDAFMDFVKIHPFNASCDTSKPSPKIMVLTLIWGGSPRLVRFIV